MILSDLAPPYLGGGETYVTNLGRELVRDGHEVHWVTSRLPNTRAHQFYEGIEIHRVPILFSRRFLFPGRQTFAFAAVIRNLPFIKNVDVVQANTLVAGYTGWRVARSYGKPSLLFCHEFFGRLWERIGQNAFERRIYPEVEKRIARSPYDWYACPSEYSKSTLVEAGAPEERITVIPHGIDQRIYNRDGNGSALKRKLGADNLKLFGYLGRLRVRKTTQSKNLKMLLEATRIVIREVPDSKLVVAGQGYEELAPVAKRAGLQDNVLYAGEIPQGKNSEFLQMCNVIVCPALSDGFCFLLAEASACGVPLVATRAGAHPDRIVHGKTGLLADTSAEALAESLIHLLQDNQLAEQMGKEAAKHSLNLSWKTSARQHLSIYESLISGTEAKVTVSR